MSLSGLQAKLLPLQQQLAQHRLYSNLQSAADVRYFMSSHIYAVWDFMSLLKALQRRLTCTELPWRPVGQTPALRRARRLINEIVLEEESDRGPEGDYLSHYELYLRAMLQAGAATDTMEAFVAGLDSQVSLPVYLQQSILPAGASPFMQQTWQQIQTPSLAGLAAAFTLGREDVIPDMFRSLIQSFDQQAESFSTLIYYLERHVELDGGQHGPLALELLTTLAEQEAQGWEQATYAAESALSARLQFWDQILLHLPSRQAVAV